MKSRTFRKAVVTSAVSALSGLLAFGLSLCAAPASASAQTWSNVYFTSARKAYIGRVFQPNLSTKSASWHPPGVVMMHGCSGMWSDSAPPTITCSGDTCTVAQGTVAQSHIEKWGRQLALEGYVAMAIDSYTTRTPTGVTPTDYQEQCNGDTYGGAVDPYTERSNDFIEAKSHLQSTYKVNANGIGELGWSQGAEAALVNSAATSSSVDTEWCAMGPMICAIRAIRRPRAVVVFYPGCGTDLGYNDPNDASAGFWRPDVPVRWNHGDADAKTPYKSCKARADRAKGFYSRSVEFELYEGAHHSFDRNTVADGIFTFPTTACTKKEQEGPDKDMCARRDADIDSLNFIKTNVVGKL